MRFALKRPVLTPKQRKFVDEYMVDMNGAAAAVRCGYSKKTSRSIACELLTKPDIQAELEIRGAELARELKITRLDVAKGLLRAFDLATELRNPGAMVSAMVHLGKLMGFDKPEVHRAAPPEESERTRRINKWLDSLPMAQLLIIAEGGGNPP